MLQVLAGAPVTIGVVTFQAEDEIAAICAAIGASYAGALGVTSLLGAGHRAQDRGDGPRDRTELPLIVINSPAGRPLDRPPDQDRAVRPLPGGATAGTATRRSPVLAAATPSDCFEVAIEAVRLATKYMTPVILLTDGYLANAAEPWRVARPRRDLPTFPVNFRTDPEGFQPFVRDPEDPRPRLGDARHRRAWSTGSAASRRSYDTGHISYDPDNHQKMTETRADKIAGHRGRHPAEQAVALGPRRRASWRWSAGARPTVRSAWPCSGARRGGRRMCRTSTCGTSTPFPRNLGDLLKGSTGSWCRK